MILTGIALIVIAILLCILVIALIPTLITIKRTAASVCSLTDMTHKELQPTLLELSGALAELKVMSRGVAEHSNDVKSFMSALGETSVILSTYYRSVGKITNIFQ